MYEFLDERDFRSWNCGGRPFGSTSSSWARVRWQVFDHDGWLLFPLFLGAPDFVRFLRFVRLAL